MSHRGYTQTKSIMERKRKEAGERQKEYSKLSLEQKLAKLPIHGASRRQRNRIEKQIALRDAKAKKGK